MRYIAPDVGVWAQLGNRTFAYTLLEFISDLNRGPGRLSQGTRYL